MDGSFRFITVMQMDKSSFCESSFATLQLVSKVGNRETRALQTCYVRLIFFWKIKCIIQKYTLDAGTPSFLAGINRNKELFRSEGRRCVVIIIETMPAKCREALSVAEV